MIKERKPTRLRDYDYSQNGCYFVTICTKNRINYFGEIENGEMRLNDYGKIANEMLTGLDNLYKDVKIDKFVVMPNHIHVIIGLQFDIVGNASMKLIKNNKNLLPGVKIPIVKLNPQMRSLQNINPEYDRTKMILSKIIQIYKSTITRKIRNISKSSADFQWQKSFYDHIIRNDKSLDNTREYVYYNPQKWDWDIENNNNKNLNKNYYTKLFIC